MRHSEYCRAGFVCPQDNIEGEARDEGHPRGAQIDQPRSHPAEPPNGSARIAASSFESATELTTDLIPGDRLNGPRIEISGPERNFAVPRLLCPFVDLRVEAPKQSVGESRPRGGGQLERLIQQLSGFPWTQFTLRSETKESRPHPPLLQPPVEELQHRPVHLLRGWAHHRVRMLRVQREIEYFAGLLERLDELQRVLE
jgi:hypothetical protein